MHVVYFVNVEVGCAFVVDLRDAFCFCGGEYCFFLCKEILDEFLVVVGVVDGGELFCGDS